MSINYIKGDVTNVNYKNKNILIIHICNNINKWGRGFVLSLSNKWPITKEKYHLMNKKLGETDFIKINNNLIVCNMIAQNGINNRYSKFIRRVDYDSLILCLKNVNEYALENNMEIHMPKIGTGLGGGDWNIIEEIIINTINSKINIYVYEL